MDARERRDGAARAEQPQIGIASRGDALGELREALRHQAAHLGVASKPCSPVALVDAARLAAHRLGQRDDAPRHAVPVEDTRHGGSGLDQDELGRTAADVEDNRGPDPVLEQNVTAEHGQARFLLRRDHVEPDARLALDALDEFGAVAGAAAGLGGHRSGEADIAPPQLVSADLERPDGAVHRRLAQRAVARQAFTEAHDPAEGIDDHEIGFRGTGDEQPAIVRAEVDRRIGLSRGGMRRAGRRRTRGSIG